MLFWAGRKAAFPAVGQITPDYMCLDGSVPRGRLVEVLAEMRRMSQDSIACAWSTSSTPATATCIR